MARQTGGSDLHPSRPFFMRMGRRFTIEAQPEIASHSEGEFRDTVSASASIGKACPALRAHSGMDFPHGGSSGNCVPFCRLIPGHTFR